MAISNKQRIAMAVIVLVGLLGGGAVLMSERAKTGGEEAEHTEAGHNETDEHAAEGKSAHKEGEKDEHGHEAKAEPKGGHNEGEKDEHKERQVKLTDEQTKAAGITVQAAGPAKLQAAAQFQGEIRFNEDRTTHVVPRLAGVAESVAANLGQLVQKGQVLAVIASTSLSEQRSELLTAQKRRDLAKSTYEREKKLWEDKISAQQDYQQAQSALQEADIAVRNASQKLAAVGATGSSTGLNRFEIRAPFSGTVVEKHLSLGEAVKEDASIFTVSDLSSVWAEFAVSPKDLAAVRVGQRVIVSSTAFESKAEGTISYVGALLGEQTRTARARVTLTNPKGAWRPGLFVTVAVLGEDQDVPLTVSADAIQTIDEQPMLFMAAPGGFVARRVKVGRSDGRTVEILGGMKPGDKYAAANTFVLKSELGKASAEHGH
jgi:cobalt-zinc-cadmium efflux system membrane fusion protein